MEALTIKKNDYDLVAERDEAIKIFLASIDIKQTTIVNCKHFYLQ